jgi:Tetracyclin repressor-like, C-terminal domain
VVERLAELTSAEIPALPVSDLDSAAEVLTTIIQTGVTTKRSRHLARYELILESVRRPELRAALTASGAVVQEAVSEQFAALGLADPRGRAVDLLALLDGLLFDAIAGTGDRDLAGPGLRSTVRALLTAVTHPGPASRG